MHLLLEMQWLSQYNNPKLYCHRKLETEKTIRWHSCYCQLSTFVYFCMLFQSGCCLNCAIGNYIMVNLCTNYVNIENEGQQGKKKCQLALLSSQGSESVVLAWITSELSVLQRGPVSKISQELPLVHFEIYLDGLRIVHFKEFNTCSSAIRQNYTTLM